MVFVVVNLSKFTTPPSVHCWLSKSKIEKLLFLMGIGFMKKV